MYERRTKGERLTKANIHRYETQEIDKHHQRSNEQDTRVHQRYRAENGESKKESKDSYEGKTTQSGMGRGDDPQSRNEYRSTDEKGNA